MRQNLKKDYLWNTLGSVATACTSFVLTIIIARVNDIEDLGLYTFTFGMAMIFAMISFFGGRNFQVTDTKGEFSDREYIIQRAIMSIVAVMVAGVFIVFNQYDLYTSAFILSLLFYKILDSFTDVIAGTLQRKHHLWVGGKSGFFKAVISIIIFTVIDLLTHNILLSSLSFILVYVIGIFTYDIYWLNKLNSLSILKGKKIDIKPLFRATYLMAIILVLQVATINILRYFMDIFRPEEQGIFGIIVLPAFIINLLVAFIISPQLTPLAEMFRENRIKQFTDSVHKVLLVTISLGALMVVAAYLLAVPIVKIVYGYDLSMYSWLITTTVIAGVFYAISVMYFSILTIIRWIKNQVIIMAGILILEIFLALMFGRNFGISAMVVIYLLSQIIQAIAAYIEYKKAVGDKKTMQDHSVLLKVLEFGRNFNKSLFGTRFAIFFMRQVLTIQSYIIMLIYLPIFISTSRRYIKDYHNLDYDHDVDVANLINCTPKEISHVKVGKTVWQFWNSGYDNIPEGIRICIDRTQLVAKKSGFDYILITDDNIGNYLYLPDFIMEKYNSGKITKPHFSDILRMALLAKYGGLWIDATYYLNQNVDLNISDREFFTLHKKIGSFAGNMAMCRWLENFIGSNKSGYDLFRFCLSGFYDYWQKHNEMPQEYLFIDYLILAFYKTNKGFHSTVKNIEPNFKGVGSMSLLSNYFHNAVVFNEKNKNRLLSQSDPYHKLDFKYPKEEARKGKDTFYKKFIEDKLGF